MTDKVNGTTSAGEFFNRDLDFFTVSSVDALASDGAVGEADQDLFDQMVEVISQKAQPIILTAVTGSGPWVFNFVIEHPKLWSEVTGAGAAAESLKDLLEDLPDVGNGNITVTATETL